MSRPLSRIYVGETLLEEEKKTLAVHALSPYFVRYTMAALTRFQEGCWGRAALQHVFGVQAIVVTQQNRLLARVYISRPVHMVIEQLVLLVCVYQSVPEEVLLSRNTLRAGCLSGHLSGFMLLPVWEAVAVRIVVHPLKGP